MAFTRSAVRSRLAPPSPPFILIAVLLAGLSRAEAQPVAQPPVEPCGAKAATYASGTNLRLWVRRAGELTRDNPLRPLSAETLLVLDVVVNGRAATAFGPDAMNLRQGGAAQRLQAEASAPIRWGPADGPLPGELRIVAEDGRVLYDQLRFVECADPPKVAASPAGRKAGAPSAAPARAAPPVRDDNRGLRLPQGAIP